MYYTLLAEQIPPKKIKQIIQYVLSTFFPDIDISSLQLPGESCAGYMRREELTTVSNAHKATALMQDIDSGKMLHINTDGTTKDQKKLNSIVVNGVVISTNEVQDGKAVTVADDIDFELRKLREMAEMLELEGASRINCSQIASSTSDSASTQKKINRLLQTLKERDDDRFEFAQSDKEMPDLFENFCAMHLGVNLRKSFLLGIGKQMNSQGSECDMFVYQFAKLFGTHGVPEYAVGVLQFPDFLRLQAASTDCDGEMHYYEECLRVKLHRQVGNRYFVTASNACKILYLAKAAMAFLEFTKKNSDGNKLEQEVYAKLHDNHLLACLRTDALMFYHVYADLINLAKSNELSKSVFDMNTHYLELKCFLEEAEINPEITYNEGHQVFVSEPQLYGDTKINHRLRSASAGVVYKHLFCVDHAIDDFFLPLIASGVTAMQEKLCTYAQNQLPEGVYWDPDDDTMRVMQSLKPNNDSCESAFGLNDYLSNAIPNMQQNTRSNLIELKKNSTMRWFNALSKKKKEQIVQAAMNAKVYCIILIVKVKKVGLVDSF